MNNITIKDFKDVRFLLQGLKFAECTKCKLCCIDDDEYEVSYIEDEEEVWNYLNKKVNCNLAPNCNRPILCRTFPLTAVYRKDVLEIHRILNHESWDYAKDCPITDKTLKSKIDFKVLKAFNILISKSEIVRDQFNESTTRRLL